LEAKPGMRVAHQRQTFPQCGYFNLNNRDNPLFIINNFDLARLSR